MEQIETGSFVKAANVPDGPDAIRIVSWNINRGLQLPGIIEFLSKASADLILLQEADVNARRTRYRNIAREIAQALRMNYSFRTRIRGTDTRQSQLACLPRPGYALKVSDSVVAHTYVWQAIRFLAPALVHSAA